jgi:uncharacterized protein with GYD domain
MPKYLVKASYSTTGARGVAKEGGTARVDAVKKAAESVGGTLEAFYFAFGDIDVYAIVDLPDNTTAIAFALTVNSSDAVTGETVALLTPEEVDAASKKTVDFLPAGS